MTELFFEKLLDFNSNWKVEAVIFDTLTDEIEIKLKFQLENYKQNNVDTYVAIHDYREIRRWRHLDILQYETFITAKIPRLITKEGKVESVNPPWASEGERHTYLFEIMVIDMLLATKNQTKTASMLRCGFNIVNRILHISTERAMSRSDENTVYKQLSIDEKSFQKGHKYATVLSDPITGKIIDLSMDRTKTSCVDLLKRNLNETQRSQVDCVSIDMWKAFISAVGEVLPTSKKVHDRFHLIKYLNEAIDKVRRREVKTNETLINSRYALLKNRVNLTEKQYFKFEDVLRINTQVSYAWRLTECFKNLFGCQNYQEAFNRYTDWSAFCNWENIPEITKVVTMFSNHMRGVCNALVEKSSNAMAERLNGKIQEIKTIARGYRTFVNFRSAILFFNGGLNLYPH
jgi:transposase